MTANLIALEPRHVAELLKDDRAVLIDVREPDEFVRRHVPGAQSRPLSMFPRAGALDSAGRTVVFTCRSGLRTAANCATLQAAVDGEAFILAGGIDGWAAAGLRLAENRRAPLEIMRQVQIAAGSLVLLGTVLGLVSHPAFFGLAAFVGAGLTFAGATGHCGMARFLALAPWNRPAAA